MRLPGGGVGDFLLAPFKKPKLPPPPPPPPEPPSPAEMPDPGDVASIQRRRRLAAQRDGGRESSIMTETLG